MSIDMDDAEQVVRAAIDKVKLPETAEEPEIVLSGPEPDPTIFSMGIYAEENYEEVQKFVADNIIPRLEAIEGVSEVETGGMEEKIVSIRILPEELIKRGITHDDVKSAIDANNLQFQPEIYLLSDEVLPVRVSKELQSLDDVKSI